MPCCYVSFVFSVSIALERKSVAKSRFPVVVLTVKMVHYFHCQNSHGFSLRSTPVPL